MNNWSPDFVDGGRNLFFHIGTESSEAWVQDKGSKESATYPHNSWANVKDAHDYEFGVHKTSRNWIVRPRTYIRILSVHHHPVV